MAFTVSSTNTQSTENNGIIDEWEAVPSIEMESISEVVKIQATNVQNVHLAETGALQNYSQHL